MRGGGGKGGGENEPDRSSRVSRWQGSGTGKTGMNGEVEGEVEEILGAGEGEKEVGG